MTDKNLLLALALAKQNGGGGGGSGEIPTFELQEDELGTYVQLPEGFATDDGGVVFFIKSSIKGSTHLYLVAGYSKKVTTGITINGIISSDEGRLYKYATGVSASRRLNFAEAKYQGFNWLDENYLHIDSANDYGQSGDVGMILAGYGKAQYPRFKSFSQVVEESGYVFEAVKPDNSFAGIVVLLTQQGVFTAMETLSSASSETYVSRYMDISQATTAQGMKKLISDIIAVVETDKKIPYMKFETNSLNWVKDYVQMSNETGMLTFEYSYWKSDKKYVHEITLGYPKLYITTICHEAISLM